MWDPELVKRNFTSLIASEIEKNPERFFSGVDFDAKSIKVNRDQLFQLMEGSRGFVETDMHVDLSPRKRQGS